MMLRNYGTHFKYWPNGSCKVLLNSTVLSLAKNQFVSYIILQLNYTLVFVVQLVS